ncbi:DUF362 domain-containing protein [Caldisericum sp.]|uniref:4Fe-4S ferredoxin-type domain-containing protein n=1 Tax=Caldisericum exile TaxID=693075 RepID=A0A2J6WFQ8_9BACT|nr:MAG: hypothetical protein C0189_00710 [Caldisericum exile]
MLVKLDIEKCIGCGICANVCPESAISISNGKAFVDSTKCTDCGLCVSKCPTGALTMENIAIPKFNNREGFRQVFHSGKNRGGVLGLGQGQGRGYGMSRRRFMGGLADRSFTNGAEKVISEGVELNELKKQVQEIREQLDLLLKRVSEINEIKNGR